MFAGALVRAEQRKWSGVYLRGAATAGAACPARLLVRQGHADSAHESLDVHWPGYDHRRGGKAL